MIRLFFLIWYAVGLLLLVTIGVPDVLSFSNGVFLALYMVYALTIEYRVTKNLRIIMIRGAIIIGITFVVEWIGITTSYPFGHYHYTPTLGLVIAGVPLTVAFAWLAIVTNVSLFVRASNRFTRAVLVGLWATTFDLVLDPVAFVRQFWIWEQPGNWAFYGVPLSNFFAWFFIFAILSLAFPVIRTTSIHDEREAMRLFQLMVGMFGVISIVEQLYIPAIIAGGAILIVEGVLKHHARTSKSYPKSTL